MGKNQMSLKKMYTYIKTLKKQAKNISLSNDKIKKTVENMNANIYHGGKTANDWYHTADASCTSNVNFLKRLDNSIGILEKLYNKLKSAADGSTETVDVNTTATGSVIGAAAGGAALGGGTPTGNNTQTTSTGDGQKQPPSTNDKPLVDNDNDSRFKTETNNGGSNKPASTVKSSTTTLGYQQMAEKAAEEQKKSVESNALRGAKTGTKEALKAAQEAARKAEAAKQTQTMLANSQRKTVF